MDEHGIDWINGCHLIGFWLTEAGQISVDFCHTPTTNLTQHDTHGPDDHPKTIWPPQNHWLTSYGYIKRWWYRWAWNWLDQLMSSHRILAYWGGANLSWFLSYPNHKSDTAWHTWTLSIAPFFCPRPKSKLCQFNSACWTRADHRSVWTDIGQIQPTKQHNNCSIRLVEGIGTRGWLVFSL
jgi:hypothetical protein